MASLISISRPYALAAFNYAQKTQELDAWKTMLETASFIAREPAMIKLFSNTEVLPEQILQLFNDLLAPQLNAERKNFLSLLSENKRLNALPSISESFNAYYAEFQKNSTVRVVTAIPMKENFQMQLKLALEKRLQSQVTLSAEIDPSIIAGAIIHIGGRVIDGSVNGQLTRLLEFSLR